MAVGFGTPVMKNMAAGASWQAVMTGVTSGQPILVFQYKWAGSYITGISDDFATPYSWIQVDSAIQGGGITVDLWIGTGGVGTSGTITVSTVSNTEGGGAVACTGASTAAGLAAVDTHGHNSGLSTSAPSPTLSASATGQGIVMVAGTGAGATDPGAPWSCYDFQSGGTHIGGFALYADVPDTDPHTATWTQASAGFVTAGCVIKAAAPAGIQVTATARY